MKRSTHALLYQAHSWTGAAVGVLLFVTCLTGTLTVFRNEIQIWSNPALWPLQPGATAGPSIDAVLDSLDAAYPLAESPFWALRLPHGELGAFELLMPASERPALIRAYVSAGSGELLGESPTQLADFLFQLHSNLSFRSKLGRYLVGLVGVAMLVSLVTGLFIHRHLWRDLFTQRWSRSRRVALADSHKAVATWALIFHLVTASTGAFLGLKNLLIAPAALALHGGDLDEAREALSPPRTVPSGERAPMTDVAALVHSAREILPGFVPTLLVFRAWGDVQAEVTIGGSLPGELLPENEAAGVTFSGVTGDVVEHEDGRQWGPWGRVYGAITPLHYGSFGGLTLQLAYLLLGVATTSLVATGLLIWTVRRDGRVR